MSIVGPRPHAVGSRAENALFWDIDDRYSHRHSVKPGLTGLAQVRGYRGATEIRSDLTNRLQSDLEYIEEWSRSEEHTSELQSLMRISYAVFCLKKKKRTINPQQAPTTINY